MSHDGRWRPGTYCLIAAVVALIAFRYYGPKFGTDGIYTPPGTHASTQHFFRLIDRDGRLVSNAEFAWVSEVAERVAEETGDSTLKDMVDSFGPEGFFGYLDGLLSTVVSSGESDSVNPEPFAVPTGNGVLFFDYNGTLVRRLGPEYTWALPYHEGLAPVGKAMVKSDGTSMDGACQYMDLDGNVVLEGPYGDARPFHDGLAVVSPPEEIGKPAYLKKRGVIDRDGAWAVEPRFNYISEFSDGLAAAQIMSEDYTVIEAGFIDRTGEFVIRLDEVRNMHGGFRDGLALVERTTDPRFTFVDRRGNAVLELDYLSVAPFSEGRAAIVDEYLTGFIDPTGKVVIKPAYFNATPFRNGVAQVTHLPPPEPQSDMWSEVLFGN